MRAARLPHLSDWISSDLDPGKIPVAHPPLDLLTELRGLSDCHFLLPLASLLARASAQTSSILLPQGPYTRWTSCQMAFPHCFLLDSCSYVRFQHKGHFLQEILLKARDHPQPSDTDFVI